MSLMWLCSPGGFQIELHNQLTARFGRAVPPSPPVQADGPIVRSRFVGTYRRMTTKVTIREEGEKLFLKSEWILSEAEGTEAYGAGPPVEVEVVALAPNVLARPGVTQVDREAGWMFIEPGADGRYQYLFVGGRLSRRTA